MTAIIRSKFLVMLYGRLGANVIDSADVLETAIEKARAHAKLQYVGTTVGVARTSDRNNFPGEREHHGE